MLKKMLVPVTISIVILLASSLSVAGVGLQIAQASIQARNETILERDSQITAIVEERDDAVAQVADREQAIVELSDTINMQEKLISEWRGRTTKAELSARTAQAELSEMYEDEPISIDPNDTAWGWRQSIEKWLIETGMVDAIEYSSSDLAWNNARAVYIDVRAYSDGERYSYQFFVRPTENANTGPFSVLYLDTMKFIPIEGN